MIAWPMRAQVKAYATCIPHGISPKELIMTTKKRKQDDQAGEKSAATLGWSAGGPTGGSNAGAGVDLGQRAEDAVHAMGSSGDTTPLANMDTSGLVESQVTRPSTVMPSERREGHHNTERANRTNQRDALAHKLNEEADARDS
jgi:hypothetical protein